MKRLSVKAKHVRKLNFESNIKKNNFLKILIKAVSLSSPPQRGEVIQVILT